MNRLSLIHDLKLFSDQATRASDKVLEAMQIIGVVPHSANIEAMERATGTISLLHNLNLGLEDIITRLQSVEDFEISNIGEKPRKSLDPSSTAVTVNRPQGVSPSAHGGREIVTEAATSATTGGEEGPVAVGGDEHISSAQTGQAAGAVPGSTGAAPTRSLRSRCTSSTRRAPPRSPSRATARSPRRARPTIRAPRREIGPAPAP